MKKTEITSLLFCTFFNIKYLIKKLKKVFEKVLTNNVKGSKIKNVLVRSKDKSTLKNKQ